MSILAKKVGRLEAAREVVKQLEREIAIDLGLSRGRRLGPLEEARSASDDELGIEPQRRKLRGPSRMKLTDENILIMAKKAQAMFAENPGIRVKDVVEAIGTSDPSYYHRVLPVMKKLPMGAPHPDQAPAPAGMSAEEKEIRDRMAQGGSKKEMAKDLGISKDSFYRRAHKYKIPL